MTPAHTTPAAPGTNPVQVFSADFKPVEITPGFYNDAADWVYRNGQCLALAVALSQHTGWPVHLRLMADLDPHCPFGCLTSTLKRGCCAPLRHAYVEAPDGTLIDIRGDHDPTIVDEECRDLDGDLYLPPRLVPAAATADLLAEYAPYMAHQDLALARTFVDSALAESEVAALRPPR